MHQHANNGVHCMEFKHVLYTIIARLDQLLEFLIITHNAQ